MISRFFLLFILILIILLSTIYSEGMDTYVMKNALVNTGTGTGRFITIDTDGNFSESGSDVVMSQIEDRNKSNTTTPSSNTTTPASKRK